MFSLITERGKYLRIRRHVTKTDIESEFDFPVHDKVFEGGIILLNSAKKYCYARPFDTYETIAIREGGSAETLKNLNKNAVIYPTMRVWLS